MAAATLSLRCCSLATVEGGCAQLRSSSRSNNVSVRCCASNASASTSSLWSSFMGAGVGPRFGLALRSLRGSRVLHQQQRRNYGQVRVRAAWAQEVLWANSPVAEVEKAAESLFHVVLDISENPELMNGFTKPGQFVQVKVGNVKPAFLAIASPPTLAQNEGRLEFLIKDVEGSTANLICSLNKGEKVELSQVMGNGFPTERIMPAEDYKTVFLFATGSGISPVRSLIETGFEANKRSDVRLYYGARNLKRMAYQDKFKAWEASGVQVIPVLSQPGEDWTGGQGYVQAFFSKQKGITNASQTGALLCGHKQMALDVTALLQEEGVSKERILLNF